MAWDLNLVGLWPKGKIPPRYCWGSWVGRRAAKFERRGFHQNAGPRLPARQCSPDGQEKRRENSRWAEPLHPLTGRVLQVPCIAELGRILFHPGDVQPVLADQQAELVAEFGLAVAVYGLRRKLPDIGLGLTARGRGTDLFDPVNGARLRHAQLRAPDQGRDVGRVGIAMADEAAGSKHLSEPTRDLRSAGRLP